jgi:hypothetical protein
MDNLDNKRINMANEIIFGIHHSNTSFPIKFFIIWNIKFESRKILQVQMEAVIKCVLL